MKNGKAPRVGPTPVGQRNRAQTIPAKKFEGPTVDEWDYDEPDAEDLAADVLTMAYDGGMPDSYWHTDQRIARACRVLDIEPYNAYAYAEDIKENQ